MQLLTAVNTILPKLGEHTVTSVDAKHPTVVVILNALNEALTSTLLRGWWFNTHNITLYPDSESGIALPVGTLSVYTPYANGIQRGSQLYNGDTLSFLWDGPVKATIKESVDFELLPECAAQYVLYSGCVQAYTTDIGLEQVVQMWQAEAKDAFNTLLAEHLKNSRYSTLRTAQFRRLTRALWT
jgi:hypothetical protein